MKPFALLCGVILFVSSMSAVSVAIGTVKAQAGNVLVIAQQSDPGILNNIAGDTLGSFLVHHMVWSELFNLGYDSASIITDIGLVESWDISADGLDYTFHLRQGVKWHDGVDFTAEDVKFTFDQGIALPTWAIAYLRTIDYITVDDPHTVTFTLVQRDAAFLTLLAFGSDFGLNILPKHLYEGTDITTNEYNFKPIGTGPFVFVEHIPGQSITLEANEDWWGGRPAVDRVVIKIIPEPSTAAQELQAGTVDYLVTFDNPLPFAQIPAIVESPDIEFTSPTTGVIIWLLFDTLDPVMGDASLREAIGYAINRTELAEKAYFNFAKPMEGFYLEGPWYHSDAELPYDPAMAVQLLDQLGFTPGTDGVRLTVEFAFHPLFGMDIMAQVLKEQLAEVGIVLDFWSADYATWFDKVHVQGEYEIALRASQIGPDPALYWQWLNPLHSGESGSTFFNDTEMVDLFNQAAESTDQDARKSMYNQIQQILRDNVPVLPLTNIEDTNLWRSDRVKGLGAEIGTNRWDISQAEIIGEADFSSLTIYVAIAVVVAIGAVGGLYAFRRWKVRGTLPSEAEEPPRGGSPP